MSSLQIGSPAPKVLCCPLTVTTFEKTQLADLQILFPLFQPWSSILFPGVHPGVMALDVPFSPPIHLFCLPRNSFKFELHFPISHLGDLIIETSSHKYMVSLELSRTPYTANKIPRVSRVRGKKPSRHLKNWKICVWGSQDQTSSSERQVLSAEACGWGWRQRTLLKESLDCTLLYKWGG